MSEWRPYEPCREHEERARIERDGAAWVARCSRRSRTFDPYDRAFTAAPLTDRTAKLRERIADLSRWEPIKRGSFPGVKCKRCGWEAHEHEVALQREHERVCPGDR